MKDNIAHPKILVLWEKQMHLLFDCTQRFPKISRFTFAQRIDNHALDLAQYFVLAQYATRRDTAIHLQEANLVLAQLRLLLRLSCDRKYLSIKQTENFTKAFAEIGAGIHRWEQEVLS
jgi:hypothetical protein